MPLIPQVLSMLFACSSCVIGTESLVKFENSTMHLMTFITFLLISLEGLIKHPEFLWTRHIPFRECVKLVFLFFAVNLMNNQSMSFNIPFPCFIIFRSGTLLANVILTFLLQNRRFSFARLFSVLLVTLGIVLFTLADHVIKKESSAVVIARPIWSQFIPLPNFLIGIFIMTACLFGSAYLGILQENLYCKYGKHPEELMFNVHFLSLPLFVIVAPSIISDFSNYSKSSNIFFLNVIKLPFSKQWCILFAVVGFQLICVRNVYQLTAQFTSLQLTMILSLRKFFNLLFSFLFFQNPYTNLHLIGCSMVFIGSFQFYDSFTLLYHSLYRILRFRNVEKTKYD